MKRLLLVMLTLSTMIASVDALYAAKKTKSKPSISNKSSGFSTPAQRRIPSSKFPSRYTVVRYKDISYHMAYGRYYRYTDNVFALTMPPIGIRIALLPNDWVSFKYDRHTYYSCGGVIYQPIDDEYEVIAPVVGMIVPELPEINVSQVTISGTTYYEYDKILYKPLPTKDGIQYEVVGGIELNK